ncbi:hypothetical protein [Bacteriovorax sp. Seq25_V]|uniref:hypothetical protein n=1 Tax=Bacteriovorax sp. Seq25_V TaxID=1201288 RepID=UPI000389FE60|nr:hypothetical protein [Bacteriovorax sp. Seq25_V]EQC45683.1 hypothetical protein M900_2142 [Bacteriovorax sp. Seq25_V]
MKSMIIGALALLSLSSFGASFEAQGELQINSYNSTYELLKVVEINVISLDRNKKEAVVTVNGETKTVKLLVVEEEFDYHDYSATYVTTFQKDVVVNDGICEEYEAVKYIATIEHEEALYSNKFNVSNVVKVIAQHEATYDTCHSPMEYQTIEYK